jgi:hypothetical protein
MIGSFSSTVKLCNVCLNNAGITNAWVQGGYTVVMLPTSTPADIDAVQTFIALPPAPCPHIVLAIGPQIDASDEWLTATALLAVIPAGSDYDTIRARYTSLVTSKLAKANNLGGLA